ncbi:hypothetical protein ACG0Z6_16175 [Roseateles sp. BYS180W]|uniref:Uncharacterized protein n=1 Tax=Roseateles rivi TaxID=3299028 RepID=A0ABW7FZQ8_9BURK
MNTSTTIRTTSTTRDQGLGKSLGLAAALVGLAAAVALSLPSSQTLAAHDGAQPQHLPVVYVVGKSQATQAREAAAKHLPTVYLVGKSQATLEGERLRAQASAAPAADSSKPSLFAQL